MPITRQRGSRNGACWKTVRVGISAVTIVAVAELSKRFPRYGDLLLSLPIVSVLAFAKSWYQYHDLPAISKLAKETTILVLLGLPFFVPMMFSSQLGLGFGTSLVLGSVLETLTIGAWFLLAAST